MNKPILKNHVVIEVITTMEQFITVIHTEPTVYVRPWHKVHPGRFFNSRHNYPPDRIQQMIDNGDFWRVMKKTENQTARIKHALADIKAAMDRLGNHDSNTTIGDVFDEIKRYKGD